MALLFFCMFQSVIIVLRDYHEQKLIGEVASDRKCILEALIDLLSPACRLWAAEKKTDTESDNHRSNHDFVIRQSSSKCFSP
jgi:hypothetical protein